jgi:hypothetical protein
MPTSAPPPNTTSVVAALLPVSGKVSAFVVAGAAGAGSLAEASLQLQAFVFGLLFGQVLLFVPSQFVLSGSPQLEFTFTPVLFPEAAGPELADPTAPSFPFTLVSPEPELWSVALFTPVLFSQVVLFELSLTVTVVPSPLPLLLLVVSFVLSAKATPLTNVAPTTPTARMCRSFFTSSPSR